MSQTTAQLEVSTVPASARDEDVRAALTFTVPQDTKPYFDSSSLTGGESRAYFQTEQRAVKIQDMRPHAGGLSLDVHGFELHRIARAVDDLYDDAAVDTVYAASWRPAART